MTTLAGSMARRLLPSVTVLLLGCGQPEPADPDGALVFQGRVLHCGNGLCEPLRGEGPGWCGDCRPKDAGPVIQYCGDHVCNNGETLFSCWRDCRPRPVRGFQGWHKPGPRPDPGP